MVAAGCPLELAQPETLRWKLQEPILLLGKQRFANVDIRLRVKGGGHVSQVYGEYVGPDLLPPPDAWLIKLRSAGWQVRHQRRMFLEKPSFGLDQAFGDQGSMLMGVKLKTPCTPSAFGSPFRLCCLGWDAI